MPRPLDEEGLRKLLQDVWNPDVPLLVGLNKDRVRKYHIKPGGHIVLRNETETANGLSEVEVIAQPHILRTCTLLYGIQPKHFYRQPPLYFLGNTAKHQANDIDLAIAMQECYVMLKRCMFKPNPELTKHRRRYLASSHLNKTLI